MAAVYVVTVGPYYDLRLHSVWSTRDLAQDCFDRLEKLDGERAPNPVFPMQVDDEERDLEIFAP